VNATKGIRSFFVAIVGENSINYHKSIPFLIETQRENFLWASMRARSQASHFLQTAPQQTHSCHKHRVLLPSKQLTFLL
jgi:hypothetical protein